MRTNVKVWLSIGLLGLSMLFFAPRMARSQQAGSQPDVAAIVSTVTPSTGKVGDEVTIVCRGLDRPVKVDFNGVSADVASIKTNTAGNQVITLAVPAGPVTGPVHITTPRAKLDAGAFTLLTASGKPDIDDPTVHGNPVGGQPGAPGQQGGGSIGGPPPAPRPDIDRYADLPVDPKDFIAPDPTKPPTPPVAPPVPVIPPPTIYGKDLISPSSSVIYVLDISGSMGWDEGQYTTPDGKTATGCRLDRAKAELTRSVMSLPKTFRFNLISYDCSVYLWLYQSVQATDQNKSLAIEWINNQQPQGGTGTGPAVAVALIDKNNKLVVLLTDGAPNCGAGDDSGSSYCMDAHRKMLDDANSQHAVIDVFGIGATGEFKGFCQQVASDNGGSYADVR